MNLHPSRAFIPAPLHPFTLSPPSPLQSRGETMPEARKIVTAVPENSETPLERLRSWVTPNRLFFVRNHFDVPELELANWRLAVGGCVTRARAWTWDELTALP